MECKPLEKPSLFIFKILEGISRWFLERGVPPRFCLETNWPNSWYPTEHHANTHHRQTAVEETVQTSLCSLFSPVTGRGILGGRACFCWASAGEPRCSSRLGWAELWRPSKVGDPSTPGFHFPATPTGWAECTLSLEVPFVLPFLCSREGVSRILQGRGIIWQAPPSPLLPCMHCACRPSAQPLDGAVSASTSPLLPFLYIPSFLGACMGDWGSASPGHRGT